VTGAAGRTTVLNDDGEHNPIAEVADFLEPILQLLVRAQPFLNEAANGRPPLEAVDPRPPVEGRIFGEAADHRVEITAIQSLESPAQKLNQVGGRRLLGHHAAKYPGALPSLLKRASARQPPASFSCPKASNSSTRSDRDRQGRARHRPRASRAPRSSTRARRRDGSGLHHHGRQSTARVRCDPRPRRQAHAHYVLQSTSSPYLFTIGTMAEAVCIALAFAIVLAFPNGRLDGPVERVLVAAVVLGYTVPCLLWLLVSPDQLTPRLSLSGCRGCARGTRLRSGRRRPGIRRRCTSCALPAVSARRATGRDDRHLGEPHRFSLRPTGIDRA